MADFILANGYQNVKFTNLISSKMCVCVCLEVSISNVIPESLDICPQLHLKQISQSSGITLLIHTHLQTGWTTCTCSVPLPSLSLLTNGFTLALM